MTLEDATAIYQKCERQGADCPSCPLNKEVKWQVGAGLAHLAITPCELFTYLEEDLK